MARKKSSPCNKFPFKTLIIVGGVILLVFIIYFFVYKSGSNSFPSLKIDAFKLFKFESGEDVGPSEEKYSLEFDNQPLLWAVEYIDKKASDVNIILHPDINSGKIKTQSFSIHLNGASLKEILDAYCAKAADSATLIWRQEGKNVFIEGLK